VRGDGDDFCLGRQPDPPARPTTARHSRRNHRAYPRQLRTLRDGGTGHRGREAALGFGCAYVPNAILRNRGRDASSTADSTISSRRRSPSPRCCKIRKRDSQMVYTRRPSGRRRFPSGSWQRIAPRHGDGRWRSARASPRPQPCRARRRQRVWALRSMPTGGAARSP
jgi:hypothetical protein